MRFERILNLRKSAKSVDEFRPEGYLTGPSTSSPFCPGVHEVLGPVVRTVQAIHGPGTVGLHQ